MVLFSSIGLLSKYSAKFTLSLGGQQFLVSEEQQNVHCLIRKSDTLSMEQIYESTCSGP